MRIPTALSACALLTMTLPAQDAPPGRALFEKTCARCHGADGNGGEMGPAIAKGLAARNDQELVALIHNGLPGRGMPGSTFADTELPLLTRYLRGIQRRAGERPVDRMTVQTTDGKSLAGEVANRGFDDLQLRTADG